VALLHRRTRLGTFRPPRRGEDQRVSFYGGTCAAAKDGIALTWRHPERGCAHRCASESKDLLFAIRKITWVVRRFSAASLAFASYHGTTSQVAEKVSCCRIWEGRSFSCAVQGQQYRELTI